MKFCSVALHDRAGKRECTDFLRKVVESLPYKIHIVRTDIGMAFADLPKNRHAANSRFVGPKFFDRVCQEYDGEHRLIKPCHLWANGRVERMNRTVKVVTVKSVQYDNLEGLKVHLHAFVAAYNCGNHLNGPEERPSMPFVMRAVMREKSDPFKINPNQFITRLNHLALEM